MLGSYPFLDLHVDAVVVKTAVGCHRGHCKRAPTWDGVLRFFIIIVGFSFFIIFVPRKLFVVRGFGAAGRGTRGEFVAGEFDWRRVEWIGLPELGADAVRDLGLGE